MIKEIIEAAILHMLNKLEDDLDDATQYFDRQWSSGDIDIYEIGSAVLKAHDKIGSLRFTYARYVYEQTQNPLFS